MHGTQLQRSKTAQAMKALNLVVHKLYVHDIRASPKPSAPNHCKNIFTV